MNFFRIRRLLWNFSQVGLAPDRKQSSTLREKVMLTNRLLILTFVVMIAFAALYLFLNIFFLAICLLFSSWIVGFCSYLISKQKFNTARVLMLLTSNSFLALAAAAFQFQGGVEYFFIPAALTAYLIFELHETKLLSFCAFMPAFFWLGPQFFRAQILAIIPQVDNSLLITFHFSNWITAFVLTIYIVHIFVKTDSHFQKRLIQANKLNALGEMAASLAHEVSNPLSIMVARSSNAKELLLSGESEPRFIIPELEKIEAMGFRVSRIIKNLATFSRDSEMVEPELVRVSDCISEAVSFCEEKIKTAKIELVLKLNDELMCLCRPVEIQQVIVNLLNNSMDAIQGQDSAWIHIELKRQNPGFQVVITDSGTGIPPEIINQIMTPFFTTKKAGKGTGLGLSISRKIVESNGGRLYLDTRLKNTCFVMDMPS